MSDISPGHGTVQPDPTRGTVLLVSGELDKALLAFDIASGMQAMGMRINMWFVLYGVNCLKKPRSFLAPRRWLPRGVLQSGPGRNTRTDTPLQNVLQILNHDGAPHLPLSQLNFLGAGPWLLNRILRRKGMATLDQLIQAAVDLGVGFKVCQICVDAMACDVSGGLVVDAEVAGVSSYALEVQASHYNAVI